MSVQSLLQGNRRGLHEWIIIADWRSPFNNVVQFLQQCSKDLEQVWNTVVYSEPQCWKEISVPDVGIYSVSRRRVTFVKFSLIQDCASAVFHMTR